jgi:hypothetical protein
MHNSDNDDEENNTKILRPSNTVPAYLLGTSEVAMADDGLYHVAPDLVSVEKTNIPGKYKVTLVDITYCLEHRGKQAIETKRFHYRLLRRALLAQGHILPEVVVIVACVRGSIPASTLDTLRNDLGLNRAPTGVAHGYLEGLRCTRSFSAVVPPVRFGRVSQGTCLKVFSGCGTIAAGARAFYSIYGGGASKSPHARPQARR